MDALCCQPIQLTAMCFYFNAKRTETAPEVSWANKILGDHIFRTIIIKILTVTKQPGK